MARQLEKIKLLFDYEVPSGFLQFGYQKNEIPEIFEYHTRVSEETFEYMDTSIIRRWDKKQQWCKSQYFQEFMSNPHNWECVMTHELYEGQNPQDRFIDSDTHYLIPMESSWWQGDFLEYTLEELEQFRKQTRENLGYTFFDQSKEERGSKDNKENKDEKWENIRRIAAKQAKIAHECSRRSRRP